MLVKLSLIACILKVCFAIVIGSITSDKSSVDSRSIGIVPEDTCVCPYDPDDQEGSWECQVDCSDAEKRMYLSERDSTEHTKRVCYCQDDDPYCNCPIIHRPWNDFDKREPEVDNTISALHPRSCPPDGQEVCHKVEGKVVCIPCIEERIVCPVYKRAQSDSAICYRGLNGKYICPPCQPSCCPREIFRALHESNSDVWCPPCDYPQAATVTEQVTDITQPTPTAK
ncbi:hypothetical protein I302_106068 [Kwoniella bestiolae CBS 10118]|uniref:Uncharacterized protein n=1 Tax=Kwoniella bestiolae CBS 10118 TaxID=1296100 RepID=A0A1B9G2Y4_9TREE|nr:hypothetical protein I302_05194 [Kwoniella bestiolae CBS 10118]OCF25375.1 hypothetical protein I302_05194 [Kwoniella bestiolae CBS 10118]